MQVLIDTSVFIWLIAGETRRLTIKAKRIVTNADADLFVSVASIWEIALKVRAGKLKLPLGNNYLNHHLRELDASLLPIKQEHIIEVLSLPRIHFDPFDALIVAQASVEQMNLVTSDDQMRKYPVKIVW